MGRHAEDAITYGFVPEWHDVEWFRAEFDDPSWSPLKARKEMSENTNTEGLVTLPGRLVYDDIVVPVIPPGGNTLRYSAGFQVSQDAPEMEHLWAEIIAVAKRVWGANSEAKLEVIQGAISQGVAPKQSPIGIQDGNLFKSEYNRGFWFITATRKQTKGAPALFGLEAGAEALDPETQSKELPRAGDGVLVMLNVWCQPQYDRMNLSVEGVRLAVRGAPIGGLSPAVSEAGRTALSRISLPTAIPGVTAPDAIPAVVDQHVRPMGVPAVPTNTPPGALGVASDGKFTEVAVEEGQTEAPAKGPLLVNLS